MKRITAYTIAALGYVYALVFGAAAGYAHPFMEQLGDCGRACQEARVLFETPSFTYGFLIAAAAACFAISYLCFTASRRSYR